ncbi:GNAT family N-acetyltransferase [Legionella brunensis]|uniref:Putative Acyl-CoA N-acyltransferase n=1 Tax=Legionella brunensis TaxID=29422 RepID=A0A0W0SKI2_9GAMM|nr:GNAT family N-acetyltransferase [Legionella brunensis]KTC83838.1 putative Acyl-CoA N-acyltransferase [Legionella brunensis]
MLLFSSALAKHQLTFTQLSDCMEHLTQAATLVEEEWGYIRNLGVAEREKIMTKINKDLYIGTLNNQLIAMFALIDKETELLPKTCELMYVYVEKDYRGLGFGRQIINEAKKLAVMKGAELILLDTLKPRLNRLYEKEGAEVFCENHLFSQPTDVLKISL